MNLLHKLFPWRKRIAELESELTQLRLEKSTIEGRLMELRNEHERIQKNFDSNKKGVRVLLDFIHRTHHLSQPIEPGTIRDLLSGMSDQMKPRP